MLVFIYYYYIDIIRKKAIKKFLDLFFKKFNNKRNIFYYISK